MDSHNIEHLAHANVWRDYENHEPSPFTQIHHHYIGFQSSSVHKISSNFHKLGTKWFPKNGYYIQHLKDYTKYLESKGRFTLTCGRNIVALVLMETNW